jgi:hypothetical protein
MSRLKEGGIVIERERKFKGEIRVFKVSYSGREMSEALDVFMKAAESILIHGKLLTLGNIRLDRST